MQYPNYEAIGDHTEGVTVVYDPAVITYQECLDFFFFKISPHSSCSDSTQYASGVWWHNEAKEQRGRWTPRKKTIVQSPPRWTPTLTPCVLPWQEQRQDVERKVNPTRVS